MDRMQKAWRRYTAIFHLFTLAISLGITWGIVQEAMANQKIQIRTLEEKHDSLVEDITQIKIDMAVTKYGVAEIKYSVGEIKDALNITPRKELHK